MMNLSPVLLVVGPTFVNLVPAKDANGVNGYIGGEAAWSAIAASYAIHQEKRTAKKEKARKIIEKKDSSEETDASPKTDAAHGLIARHLRVTGARYRSLDDLGAPHEVRSIPTDTKIDNVKVVALTTLSEEHQDPATIAARAAFRQSSISIVASPSHMPVDVYKTRTIQDSNIDGRYFDERPFNVDAAYREFSHTPRLPMVAIFSGTMLGHEKAQKESLALAQWLRDRGTLIIADLRAPMERSTVEKWAQTANVIKMSANECAELTGHESGKMAASSLLKTGASLVILTKGHHGSDAHWDDGQYVHQNGTGKSGSAIVWQPNYVHHALPVKSSYNPRTKFKAGAAFAANLALSMIKFGINARNIQQMVRVHGLVENLGSGAVERTTRFLKIAEKLSHSALSMQPRVSRPIIKGASASAVRDAIYAEPQL